MNDPEIVPLPCILSDQHRVIDDDGRAWRQWWHMAQVGEHFRSENTDFAYVEGYRLAAKALIADLVRGEQSIQSIASAAYPIWFLCHHHLELSLKWLLSHLQPSEPPPHDHNLVHLWKKARQALERKWPSSDWAQNEHASRMLDELGAIDPVGQAGRYKVSSTGNYHFQGFREVHLKKLYDSTELLHNYFSAIASRVHAIQSSRMTGDAKSG